MRLIDADHFLNFIKGEMKQDRPDDMHLNNIIRVLEDLPTAYDVDKVVAELEEKSDDIPVQSEENYDKGFDDGIWYAIEIVKRGGIDELRRN